MKIAWELIEGEQVSGVKALRALVVYRAKVLGGWLLLTNTASAGIAFLQDPTHQWDGSSIA